jgi:DNA-directed RNA polymerase subunit M
VKKGDDVYLKCPKCGFEVKPREGVKYGMKYQVEKSKRTATASVSEKQESKLTPEEREMLKEYYEIFLEEFARSEVEEESEE